MAHRAVWVPLLYRLPKHMAPRSPEYAPFIDQEFVMFIAKMRKQDLAVLGELMKSGEVTPVIDRSYPLDEVPDAIRYSEKGHARGKIIITVD